mgnify:CR=1 FL=1
MLEQALCSGICSVGVDAYFLGPLPTPGIAYLTRGLRAYQLPARIGETIEPPILKFITNPLTGERSFRITPDQYRAFAARLDGSPYLPRHIDGGLLVAVAISVARARGRMLVSFDKNPNGEFFVLRSGRLVVSSEPPTSKPSCMPSSRIDASTCAANASLNSMTSMSASDIPASLSAFGTALIGPTPITSGSTPTPSSPSPRPCGPGR